MFTKGMRVRHPNKPEWGLGQVLEDAKDGHVRVFFVDDDQQAGRNLRLTIVTPVVVTGPDAAHFLLDNLGPEGNAYISMKAARENFRRQFPQEFHGSDYLERERNYKVTAHDLAVETLDEAILADHMAAGRYQDICKAACKVVAKTNLVFSREQIKFNAALKEVAAHEVFARALVDHLYGKGPLQERFEKFAEVLDKVGALFWTTATYFLFIRFPGQYMFMKPFATLDAAERMRFDIRYDRKPNWRTYAKVLELANHLKDNLADLRPRDMIDVQTFIWCSAEKPARKKKGEEEE